jgi:hypothetical protein
MQAKSAYSTFGFRGNSIGYWAEILSELLATRFSETESSYLGIALRARGQSNGSFVLCNNLITTTGDWVVESEPGFSFILKASFDRGRSSDNISAAASLSRLLLEIEGVKLISESVL